MMGRAACASILVSAMITAWRRVGVRGLRCRSWVIAVRFFTAFLEALQFACAIRIFQPKVAKNIFDFLIETTSSPRIKDMGIRVVPYDGWDELDWPQKAFETGYRVGALARLWVKKIGAGSAGSFIAITTVCRKRSSCSGVRRARMS